MRAHLRRVPPILYGAYTLAALSLIWSSYAITDLMDSGRFGLSVAIAGDIGWMSVLWAEHHQHGGRTVKITGWAIALGVATLLLIHGIDERSVAQAIAGPFVVLVGKTVGTIALFVLRDPAALTAEQEAEIHDVMRDSEYKARLHAAHLDQFDREADARIARIRAEARVTLARDDTDFRIGLERMEKRAEIERRTPLALPAPVRNTPTEPTAQPTAQPTDPPTEPKAQPPEPHPRGTAIVLASSLATTPEPPAQTPTVFGFSAHLTAQSAQRAEAITKVAELLAQDPGLTSGQVAETLSVSPATAKRYLREARQGRS